MLAASSALSAPIASGVCGSAAGAHGTATATKHLQQLHSRRRHPRSHRRHKVPVS